MKKIIEKIMIIIILMIICVVANISYANAPIIEQKKIEGTPITIDEGNLTKKITNINKEDGEITIQLKLDITKDKTITDNTEIFFVIDNSSSMNIGVTNTNLTRREKVINSTQELIKKINKNNPNAKMGIISFGVSPRLIQGLTNNKQQLLNSCAGFNNIPYEAVTNIVPGITLAKSNFSSNTTNRILVVLTDGYPTDDLAKARNSLIDPNTYIITTLVGLENANASTKSIIKGVFGTEQAPIADRFYNIADAEIETTISKNIYDIVLEDFQGKVTNINIKDYFPQEIINNFDITIKNTVNGTANKTGNVISWSIAKLQSKENATLEYVLKLKNGYSESIVNKVLNTNEKVEMTYNDMNNRSQTRKMPDSPQIILNKAQSVNTDNSTSNNESIKLDKDKDKNTNTGTSTSVNDNVNTNVANSVTNTNVSVNIDNNASANDSDRGTNKNTNIDENIITNQITNTKNKVETTNIIRTTSNKVDNTTATSSKNVLKGADNTTANKMLSKTGNSNIILVMIVVVSVISIIMCIKNRKYIF